MRSWRPFCWGWPGLIRSMPIPSRSHQTASLLKLNKAWAEAKGTPLSVRILAGRPRLLKKLLKHGKSVIFAGGRKSLTGEEKTASVIGDRQWIAVLMIPQQELALVIGAPQLIRFLA